MRAALLPGKPVAHHEFCEGTISLFIHLVLSCAVSQRAASAVLDLLAPYLPELGQAPCPNAGRLWLLRLGLYELTREKEQAQDWIWLIDQTVQLGSRKALIIVGVRSSVWNQKRRPLVHQDLTLLHLTALEKSTGKAVEAELRQTALSTGAPRGILSDGGGELQKGIKDFGTDHPQTALLRDIKHHAANLLKHRLLADRRWSKFIAAAQRTKLRVMLTELAFLNPPALKKKARYMNLEPLVAWGNQTLTYLDDPRPMQDRPVDRKKLRAKVGWLLSYRRALAEWSQWLQVVHVSEDYVRDHGYHAQAADQLAQRLQPIAKRRTSQALVKSLVAFVRKQSASAERGEHLLGSTEVLESLIGKYKRLQGTHSQGGMTAMVLTLGAIVTDKNPDEIRRALETIKTHCIADWCREHLGPTIQGQRKIAFPRNKNRTKKSN